MQVMTQRDMDVLKQLLELAGSQAVFEQAIQAVRNESTGPLELSALIREIIKLREAELRPLVEDKSQFAHMGLQPA